MPLWQSFVLFVLRFFLRVHVLGATHLTTTETALLLIANPTNLVGQWLLLTTVATQPDKNWLLCTHTHPQLPPWQYRLFKWLLPPQVTMVSVDPTIPKEAQSVGTAAQSLTDHLGKGGRAVVLSTGGTHLASPARKQDGWSLLVAQRLSVPVVAVHIDHTPDHTGTRQWRMTILSPRHLGNNKQSHTIDQQPQGTSDHPRQRRLATNQWGEDLLGEAALAHHLGRYTLWQMLCRAARQHGPQRLILTDSTGKNATYRQLLTRALILGRLLATQTQRQTNVGILLPTSTTAITTFFALQVIGRIPAMLNFTAGPGPVSSACRTAHITTVYTSKVFVRKAGLDPLVTALQKQGATVVFLEDLLGLLKPWRLLLGALLALFPEKAYSYLTPHIQPEQPAVVLFTSGSEGEPKGVVLSHDNLLANSVQIHARIAVTPHDLMLNVLPMFHAFGLTIGTLLPLFSGIRCHGLPSPLEYTFIPELAYTLQASLLAGTDTFLSGYARAATACDFSSIRYVFAGAEPLREETQHLWMERFGIRILEGYGTTETSPVLAVNTPMAHRSGTVGRLLPGLEYRLDPVPGIAVGALLSVRGPNIMLGYLLPAGDGTHHLPTTTHGNGWYTSGDIVSVDAQGFVRILGRAKRFAKIAGEMISLATVEALAAATWPEYRHAVISRNDPNKGEQLVLVTEHPSPDRQELLAHSRRQELTGLYLPKKILPVTTLPLLGSGKVDLSAVTALVAAWDEVY